MIEGNYEIFQQIGYVASAILFIFGLKMLGKEETAVRGNFVSAIGMLLAVVVTFVNVIEPILVLSAILIGSAIGSLFALRVKMTSIPEMVALFNGFGGLSSFFLAWSEFTSYKAISPLLLITYLTVFIGGITFSGSVIAYFKLSEIIKFNGAILSKLSRYFLIVFIITFLLALTQIILQILNITSIDIELNQQIFLG